MFSRTGHQEHHRRVEALVQRWLAERQALIVAWTALQDAQRGNASPATLSARLEAFCEILMDYVSAGHFEVYDELLAEAERRDDGPAPASQTLLGQVQATTDAVLRFNDLCENPHDAAALAHLPRELPILGLELESRFQTEDSLIALLHDSAGPAAVTAGDRP